MANNSLQSENANKEKVEYYTDPKAWNLIKEYIPKNKPIWCPFYNIKQSKSLKTRMKMLKMGFRVCKNKPDFFTYTHKNSVVVDNPPFNIKKDIIAKLVDDDIPFILLLPNNIFSTKYIKQYCLESEEFQFIMPLSRIKFTTNTHNDTTIHTCFFCYKIGLKDRMTFIYN
jgi:hypothetical protein